MSQIRRPSLPSLPRKLRKRLTALARKISYASWYHEYRLKGKHPLRLLGTPKDLWAGSCAAGAHILSDRFYDQGQLLRNPDHKAGEWPQGTIWRARDLDPKSLHYLHSFCWLRDLSCSVDRNAARQKALALTGFWLKDFDQWHDRAWSPDILGQRIINWMAYAPLILDSNDLVYRSKILNCLARQARHLYHRGDRSLRGLPRMRAIGGLIMAGLYVPYGEDWLKKGTAQLNKALGEEIFSDGGVASRNPEDLYRILRDSLMIRQSYKAMGHDVPEKLNDAISRMTPMLKALLHGDGSLALFNGASEQDAQEIEAVFSFSDTASEDFSQPGGEESGFRRLHQGATIIIADTGPPAPMDISGEGHAGTVSFEMSYGKHRMIVNCGSSHSAAGAAAHDLDRLSRSTAAHSTLVLEDKNSSEIRTDGLIGRGPTRVISGHNAADGHMLVEASHDGYMSRFGIMHSRTIYLNETGHDVRGEDILKFMASKAKAPSPKFDVRFHLHPDVIISRQGAKDRLLLRLPTSEYWQFQCSGGAVAIEESLYLGAGSRPQNCRQIVVSGTGVAPETVIKWSLRQIERSPE